MQKKKHKTFFEKLFTTNVKQAVMLRNKDDLDSILQPNDAGTVRDNHMQIRYSLCEDAFDGEPHRRALLGDAETVMKAPAFSSTSQQSP